MVEEERIGVRWSRLTMPKEMAGMVFKDLITFNKAILTKTAGRLNDEQDALWVRVMNKVYYPRGTLMEANKGTRPPWAWASILTERDILKEHGMWCVGTGNRIKVFKDAWILGLNRTRITLEGREVEEQEICVDKKIEPNERRWDLARLERIITEEERAAIQPIHLNHNPE